MSQTEAPRETDERETDEREFDEREFDELLDYLKRVRAFDFSSYKLPGLMRRIQKRLQTVGLSTYGDYLDYLEVHPDEFLFLFNTILINVTSFFRDAPAWEYLSTEILPKVAARKPGDEPIRVWVAGCSTGEEAITIAICLAECIGEEKFKRRAKIYCTDIDEEALAHARLAVYSRKDVEPIPRPLLARYFEPVNDGFGFRKDLRAQLIFGRNDLLQDAPISRIDLLLCRNTLMYFNAAAQSRILANFNFALRDDGYLFLGKSEMLLTHADLFTPFDLKRRVFTKVVPSRLRERRGAPANGTPEEPDPALSNRMRIRELAYDASPIAQIVVGVNSQMLIANQAARTQFSLTPKDQGRPLQDLEISYRPIELRSLIEQAYAECRPVVLKSAEWKLSQQTRYLDVHIIPLHSPTGELLGVNVAFADVTQHVDLQEELIRSKQELETLNEELQSTNEELETSNEEIQSTNEELETLNEELQSTNEELETMNEELQSTNEELETVNNEMQERTIELNRVNSFLESILKRVTVGVVVLDHDMRIHIWNYRCEDLWGLRADEVRGTHFLSLDIGLPVEQLRPLIRDSMADERTRQDVTLKAINRRGKLIECRISCEALDDVKDGSRYIILMIEDTEVQDAREGNPAPKGSGAPQAVRPRAGGADDG